MLVLAAMCAAGIGCNACASDCAGKVSPRAAGGGALTVAQSGQSSMRLTTSVLLPSAFLTKTFITPEPVQISSVKEPDDSGLIKGDAAAAPTAKANHTSTKRAIRLALRRRCKRDISLLYVGSL